VTQNPGVYQVNIQVPSKIPPGDQAFAIAIAGVSSPLGGYITVSSSQ
jgi:uncharacterized protein (TIGR03437 family)